MKTYLVYTNSISGDNFDPIRIVFSEERAEEVKRQVDGETVSRGIHNYIQYRQKCDNAFPYDDEDFIESALRNRRCEYKEVPNDIPEGAYTFLINDGGYNYTGVYKGKQ